MASMAAILAAVSFAAAGVALRRRAAKKKGVHDSEDEISNLLEEHRSNQKKGAEKAPAGILAWRIILGVGIGFGSFQAPWQALPVLIDRKIIRDPALQLSDAELTISQTVIFVGWLLGAMALHPLMQRLVLKQVLVLIAIVMLAVSIAAITLPYFTPLSMTLLCGVRLLHGMCLNIQGVQYMYMQNCFPSYGSQLCSLVNALYAVVAVLMAVLCGSLTLQSDWRIESLTWFGLPIILGLFLGFPDLGNEVSALPRALLKPHLPADDGGLAKCEAMTRAMRGDLINLAFCFSATVFAYYGLSYSADSLSTNPFMSAMIISGSDIIACMFASRASALGRNTAQTWSFLVAGVCLMACAAGVVDSIFVMTMAILARMALSVVFVTIYVALAEIFPPWCQKTALPACELMARLGGCLSPSFGTLPVHLSLPLFGLACLVAARATTKLPDKHTPKEF